MKQFKRLTALLLCLAMVLCLFGCDTEPEPTEPTVTEPEVTDPPPTEPPAEEVYADARAALDNAENLTLSITVTTTTTVADQVFTELSEQTLTYAGIGTDALQVAMEENLTYNIHDQDEEEEEAEDEEDKFLTYTEIYSDGTVYSSLEDTYYFAGPLTAEECAVCYLPPVLLDAALYGSLISETTGTTTTISFSEPTAAESWAIPEDAELIDAAGTALLNDSGALTQMNYTITYRHGPAEVTLEVESKPQSEANAITVPEDADSYAMLQQPGILRLYVHGAGILAQADSTTASSLESIYTQAGGVMRNQSITMDVHGEDEDVMTKIETGIYVMDYSTYQSQQQDQEETYRDGKYVITVNDGVPTSQTGVPHEDIEDYCYQIMISHLGDPEYWQDAVVTNLGSVYLVEYTYTEDFGNSMQNAICNMFWEDPGFLNNLASAYVTNKTTGYIAYDRYTGLPTSAGYHYEGTHTIDGTDYTLSIQSDQSIEAPALAAYKTITDELAPETEPEEKATPLFYHVTGADGQEMWMLGTIHVGDERTGFLPQEIYDAFNAADALAVEFNSNAFDEKMEEDESYSEKISDYYYYSDGSTVADHVDAELYEDALKLMKASGNYNMNTEYLKPSIWSNSIENFFLRQGYHLTGDKGMDNRLLTMAEEQEKEILDVESGEFQIDMMTSYSDGLQELLLEGSVYSDPTEYWMSVEELYEKWCAGDEAVMREALADEEEDTSEMTEEELAEYEAAKPYIEEYNNAMSIDRNEDMLDVAIGYLESGKKVFFAVGLAHLLNETNGLVDALREAGYTVELVQYAQ